MKRTLLVNTIALLFIVLFLYTGIEKILNIRNFREQLIASPILSPVAGIVSWTLPALEFLTAILLFVPRWKSKGLYTTLVLMIVFTIYVVSLLVIDSHLSCSCGGMIENLSPRQHLWFNIAAILLASLALYLSKLKEETVRIRWASTLGLFCLLGIMTWTIYYAAKAPRILKTGMEGRLLPSFNILMMDSVTRFNTKDIPTGKPFIVMGFSPFCYHCQAQVNGIIYNIAQFKDTQIYMVTPFSYKDLKVFYNSFHLDRYPSIHVGIDSQDVFMTYFKSPGIPYVAIFDGKKRLKEARSGSSYASELVKSLQD